MMQVTNAMIRDWRQRLADLFPRCFMREGAERKVPLKVGIRADLTTALEARGIQMPDALVEAVLRSYTVGTKYAAALAAGGQRFGLDGEAAGTVSREARERAASRLSQLDKVVS